MGERLHRVVQWHAADELLDGEIFDTLLEAKVLIERWRKDYNTHRPHSALGYSLPAPEAIELCWPASATLQLANRELIEVQGTLT